MYYKWILVNTNQNDGISHMDEKIFTLFADLPILPRSEIYFLAQNMNGEIIFKQGCFPSTILKIKFNSNFFIQFIEYL